MDDREEHRRQQSIIEKALAKARELGKKRITGVQVAIGEIVELNRDSIQTQRRDSLSGLRQLRREDTFGRGFSS